MCISSRFVRVVDAAGSASRGFMLKLLLDPHRAAQVPGPVVSSERLLGSLNKTAEQVAADYLKQVWNYTTNDIARSQGDGWQSRHPLRVVLTVLVSEPEAAALRVLREKNQDQTVQVCPSSSLDFDTFT